MRFSDFFAPYARAVMVRNGVPRDVDIRDRNGVSVLSGQAAQIAPTVKAALRVSSTTAALGGTITVTPGVYAGLPAPTVARYVERTANGVTARTPLAGTSFTAAKTDTGTTLKLVEVATNTAGEVESAVTITVPRTVPQAISTVADRLNEMVSDTPLVIDFAPKFHDAVSYEATPMLNGMAMGADGRLSIPRTAVIAPMDITVRARNPLGLSDPITFRLAVSASVAAPTGVTLSATSRILSSAAALPVTLATATATGTTDPVSWSLTGADAARFEMAGADLRLTAMPLAGSYAVNVRASNAAGTAQAPYALSVAAPVTAVNFSRSAAIVETDDALPVELATVTADGTGTGLSLVSAPAGVSLDVSVTPARLMLTAMPPLGTISVQVRAANSINAVSASFALSIVTPAANAGDAIAVNGGTVSGTVTNPDGSITFTLTETGGAATPYTIPTATVAAGYPMFLAPQVTSSPSAGTFTVTKAPLVAAPSNDPGDVTYQWHADGVDTGLRGTTFTWRDGGDQGRKIECVAMLTNVAMSDASVQPLLYSVTVQTPPVTTYTPMIFRKADNDRVIFPSPASDLLLTNAALFARITLAPDAGETDYRGVVAYVRPTIELSWFAQTTKRLNLVWRSYNADGSLSAATEINLMDVVQDQPIDVVVLQGVPFSAGDSRNSVRIAMWQNNSQLTIVDGGPGSPNRTEANKLAGVAAKLTTSAVNRMGGSDANASVGGVTQKMDRFAFFAGIAAANLPATVGALRGKFVDAAGALINPDVAIGTLGTPIVDFRNTTGTPVNYGTLGAPTSMSTLT